MNVDEKAKIIANPRAKGGQGIDIYEGALCIPHFYFLATPLRTS